MTGVQTCALPIYFADFSFRRNERFVEKDNRLKKSSVGTKEMNIHNQFSFNYFIVFTVILLAVNLLIFKFKKIDWRELFNWKSILLALVFTFLGLFYSEISHSKDWIVKTYGFPRYFYLTKKPFGGPFCVEIFIQEFKYLNFIQDFLFCFLSLNLMILIFKKTLK